MKLTIIAFAILFSFTAHANLAVHCKTNKENVEVQLQLQKLKGSITVNKDGQLAFINYISTTYDEKWNSIQVDGTINNGEQINGAKIYFESSRENSAAAIRPYGLLINKLFPGEEGIVVYGMTCDQDFEAIKAEITSNL